MKSYYDVLGVSKSATQDEIALAYKKKRSFYHPDRNKAEDAGKRFSEVQEAYEALKDPKNRKHYDQFGKTDSFQQQGQGFGSGGFGDIFEGFSEAFENLFTGGKQQRQQQKGQDVEVDIILPLKDAFFGLEKEISFMGKVKCATCSGSGSKTGTVDRCKTCHGQGVVYMQQGPFRFQQTCTSCSGSGYKITQPCGTCYGRGGKSERRTIKFKIPAGVDNNQQIKLSGQGNYGGLGSVNGDLFININVKKDEFFTRKDSDLYCIMPVSFFTMVCGGTIDIPLFDENIQLKIKPGTRTDSMQRLSGKGMTNIHGSRGSLWITLIISVPISLNEEQKELIQKFNESLSSKNKSSTQDKSWYTRMKNLFSGDRP